MFEYLEEASSSDSESDDTPPPAKKSNRLIAKVVEFREKLEKEDKVGLVSSICCEDLIIALNYPGVIRREISTFATNLFAIADQEVSLVGHSELF